MRSKSPELMKEICEYAEQYYLQNGHKLYYSSKKFNCKRWNYMHSPIYDDEYIKI